MQNTKQQQKSLEKNIETTYTVLGKRILCNQVRNPEALKGK